MATAAGVLAPAVDAVVADDLTGLSVVELQEAYAAVAPQVQRLTGYAAAVLAELEDRTGGQLPTPEGRTRPLPGWVAETGGDSASAAGRQLRIASALRSVLPQVSAAVLTGSVPHVRAQVLTRLVGRIDRAALAEAQPQLIEVAQRLDPAQLAAWVRHQIATWVEPALDADERHAADARYLTTRTQADGSTWGSFRLPAGDAETVLTALEPLARRCGDDDTRSAAHRRADALVEVCEQVLRHGQLPDAGGLRPQLSYVLPADWAARRAAEHSCTDCRRCADHPRLTYTDLAAASLPGAGTTAPAEHACAVAAWTGPQTRTRIETLLCTARITRVLLDPTGQVTGLQPLRDGVTSAQRRALAARDLGCAARGCTRPPAMCDTHHLTARADGGDHRIDNLVLLCRRHHVLWHLGTLHLTDLETPWHPQQQQRPPPVPLPF